MADNRVQGTQAAQKSQQQALQKMEAQKLAQYSIAQESAKEEFQEWGDLNAWNPLAMARNFQNLERRAREKARADQASKEQEADEEKEVETVEKIQKASEYYQRKNPELQAKTLLSLQVRISRHDSVEDIIRKLKETFQDISLADEALDFLLETADADMRFTLEKAKEELNRLYGREIRAGRNMGIQARNFSAQGLGSSTALRDLYREITSNPRDAHMLYQELSSKFPFEKMKTVIDFMLHSLGADVKAKGPSIAKEDLQRMMGETRNMQAILGVFKFFFGRMRLIVSSFDRQGMVLPPRINFELLGKLFMKFIQERYPSVDKALLLSQQMGIADEVLAQLIIYLQFRDGMRQVAPRLFRDERQRQELLMCLVETLEELEEELEEEDEEKKKKKKK
jgi:type III secretion protein W